MPPAAGVFMSDTAFQPSGLVPAVSRARVAGPGTTPTRTGRPRGAPRDGARPSGPPPGCPAPYRLRIAASCAACPPGRRRDSLRPVALFVVIRVPDGGRPALAGAPNVFDSRAEALARIAEIETGHRKAHHTYLEVLELEEPLGPALARAGVLI